MAWVYLDLMTLNHSDFWVYGDVFPSTTQAIRFVETLVVQGTPVSPENVSIRALFCLSQNLNGIDEHTDSIVIYPSNVPIIYRIPSHPFLLPRIGLKLLGNRYDKYNPLWGFQVYYWKGDINGVGSSAPIDNSLQLLTTQINQLSVTISSNLQGNLLNNPNSNSLAFGSDASNNIHPIPGLL